LKQLRKAIAKSKRIKSAVDVAIRKLNRAAYDKDRVQDRHDMRVAEQIAYCDGVDIPMYSRSPEDAYINKENEKERDELINIINSTLTRTQLKTFKVYMETLNIRETARKLRKSEPVVFRAITAARKKILSCLGDRLEDFKAALLPEQSRRIAHKPIGMGHPYEHEMALAEGLSWQGAYGVKKYTRSCPCHIPEYLQDTKSDSICTICEESCTRKDEFPQYRYVSKEHQDEIDAITLANTLQ
jgi:DNA-directed RNA polymerase specialized sigma24 family protein